MLWVQETVSVAASLSSTAPSNATGATSDSGEGRESQQTRHDMDNLIDDPDVSIEQTKVH